MEYREKKPTSGHPLDAPHRLYKEYIDLMTHPLPNIRAEPDDTNLLKWFFVVKGEQATPYNGGYYFGFVDFPRQYPQEEPIFTMITPNGHFAINTKLCLELLRKLERRQTLTLKFCLNCFRDSMIKNEPTRVYIKDKHKQQMAKDSGNFNLRFGKFVETFPDIVQEIIACNKNAQQDDDVPKPKSGNDVKPKSRHNKSQCDVKPKSDHKNPQQDVKPKSDNNKPQQDVKPKPDNKKPHQGVKPKSGINKPQQDVKPKPDSRRAATKEQLMTKSDADCKIDKELPVPLKVRKTNVAEPTTYRPPVAASLLQRDYINIMREPIRGFRVQPHSENLLKWFFVFKGQIGTPYQGGYYFGYMDFPIKYPSEQPLFTMVTPNGRFAIHTKLCLDFYENLKPSTPISLKYFLTAFRDSMIKCEPTMLFIKDEYRRKLARNSGKYNLTVPQFVELFPEVVREIKHTIYIIDEYKAKLNIKERDDSSSDTDGTDDENNIAQPEEPKM